MSGPQLDVRPAELRAAAPQLRTVAEAVQTAQRTLQAALDAEGTCWGNDDLGSEFAKHYLPHRDQAQTNLTQLATALQETGRAVDEAAAAFARTERQNAGNFGGPGA